jgi:hypothetical protein
MRPAHGGAVGLGISGGMALLRVPHTRNKAYI